MDAKSSKKLTIPLWMYNGGKIKRGEKVLEYRFWGHPKSAGDDRCYTSNDLVDLKDTQKKAKASVKFVKVESIIGVVKRGTKYYEVSL